MIFLQIHIVNCLHNRRTPVMFKTSLFFLKIFKDKIFMPHYWNNIDDQNN